MGALVSCQRKVRVAAKSASTHSTERTAPWADGEDPIKTGEATEKTVVTTLQIGDGSVITNPDCDQVESTQNRRDCKENKTRRGIFKPKLTVGTTAKEEIQDQKDFGAQHDYLPLPGQVSPSYTSSPCASPEPKDGGGEYHKVSSVQTAPDDRKDTADAVRAYSAYQVVPMTGTGDKEQLASASAGDSPMIPIKEDPVITALTNQYGGKGTELVCSCVLAEPPLPAELLKQPLCKCCAESTLQELVCSKPEPVCCECAATTTTHVHGSSGARKTSPRLSRKTVMRRENRAPVPESPRSLPVERGHEFKYTLEQIMQRSLPCTVDAMEVAAVTGTHSSKLRQPSYSNYQVMWKYKVMRNEACGDFTGAGEGNVFGQGANKPLTVVSSNPLRKFQQSAFTMGSEGGDIFSDDYFEDCCREANSADSAHSATDNAFSSDENNDDLAMDCIKECVDKSVSVRPSSLTTLKDGDSADGGGFVCSVPSKSAAADMPDTLGTDSHNATVLTSVELKQGLQDKAYWKQFASAPSDTAGSRQDSEYGQQSDHDTEDLIQKLSPRLSDRNTGLPVARDTLQGDRQTFGQEDYAASIVTQICKSVDRQERQSCPSVEKIQRESEMKAGKGFMDKQHILDVVNDANSVKVFPVVGDGAGPENIQEPLIHRPPLELNQGDHAVSFCHQPQTPQAVSQGTTRTTLPYSPRNTAFNSNAAGHGDTAARTVSQRTPRQSSDVGVAAAAADKHSVENTPSLFVEEGEHSSVLEEEWEMVTLHRVFGQTNLSDATAPVLIDPSAIHNTLSQPPRAFADVYDRRESNPQHEGGEPRCLPPSQVMTVTQVMNDPQTLYSKQEAARGRFSVEIHEGLPTSQFFEPPEKNEAHRYTTVKPSTPRHHTTAEQVPEDPERKRNSSRTKSPSPHQAKTETSAVTVLPSEVPDSPE